MKTTKTQKPGYTLARLLAFSVASLLTLSEVSNATVTVVPTTTNGTVPGTGQTFTITSNGTARALFFPGSSDAGLFDWTNNFPEYATTSQQVFGPGDRTLSYTVTFSAPVAVSQLVFGVNSLTDGFANLSLSGGTATTADFTLTDGLEVFSGPTGMASYDGPTGTITASNGDNRTLIVGSTSSNTVTSMQLNALGGTGDGYTIFFGVAVPEPTSALLLVGSGAMLLLRRRRAAAL